MAKQGMKRFYPKHDKNSAEGVPQIQGKAKHGHHKAPALIAGGEGKVYHNKPALSGIDNDLALENMANDFDMTMADLQDFRKQGLLRKVYGKTG